jgi:oligopeptide/dipeptide ABC transporter ATP-binding protein
VRRIGKTFEDFAARPLGLSGDAFKQRVIGHLDRLKLSPDVLRAYPHELSGGMRQRVTIGLATVCHPEFIIADEPTTALDVVVQKEVLSLIRDIQKEMGASVVFVTHDMSVHAKVADRVGIIYAGRLVEEGPTREMFFAPKHPYTAHLVASLPRIGDTAQRPAGAGGRPPSLASPPAGCRFHPRCPLAVDKCRTEVPPLETVGKDHRTACWRWQDCGAAGGAPCKPRGDGMTTLLDINNVSKRFTMGGLLSRKVINAVEGASFALSVEKPEIFTIIGESGSGKTTLARMILGLELPSNGTISFRGKTVSAKVGRAERLDFMANVQPCSRTRSKRSIR